MKCRSLLQSHWRMLLSGAAGGCLIVLAYGRFFTGTYFSQDDYVWLCFGKFTHQPCRVFWTDTLCGQFYRPIGELWWWIVHSISGEYVLGYQLAFLSIHLVASFLAGTFACRVCDRKVGCGVGFLFALNPLFVSGISSHYLYIFDTLGFCFYLLSVLLTMQAIRCRANWLWCLSLIAALGSYFCKEAYYTLPAIILCVSAISAAGGTSSSEQGRGIRWNWRNCFRQASWIIAHVAVWSFALIWRTAIIDGLGGYGVVSAAGAADASSHAIERIKVFAGFGGWSILPFLERWSDSGNGTLIVSVFVLTAATLISRQVRPSPGILWIWLWVFLTWSPSAFMVTYAPVSFYASSFGTILLLITALSRMSRFFEAAVIAIGLVSAISAFQCYREMEPYAAVTREQHLSLRRKFPQGGLELPTGSRVFLLRSSHNLLPDAIVKYGTPDAGRMADVLFFNDKLPVNWVMTNPEEPRHIEPVFVSPDYQDGFMDMDPYRVYPLSFENRRNAVLRAGAPFRFMKWEGNLLIDITSDNPALKNRAGEH